MLDAWDEDAHKYREAGSGGLHTKERCEEAKAKLEQKNDHGNEDTTPTAAVKEYVDHTIAKGLQQFKVFSNASAEGLTREGNEWIKEQEGKKQVKLIGQLQYDNGIFAITIYFEEIKQ